MAGRLTLAEQAVDCFGVNNQIRKSAEEMLEAAASLLKLLDKASGKSEENINKAIEELADTKICIEQLETIFDKRAIAKVKNQKEVRLFDTICRVRSERNRGADGYISSYQASGVQRGNSIKQSGAGPIQPICEGEGGYSGVDLYSSQVI